MNFLEHEIIDTEFIITLIPQKPPFVMVDKLIYHSPEKVISGFTIKDENLFTTESNFEAAGLIENMAQTIALHTGYLYFLKKQPAPTGYLGAIKKVTINALPKIGAQLITTVNILHEIMGVTLVNATITCRDEFIASSEMKTVLAN